ncbi:MAG: YncE family protein [Acidobacteriaceae bacterium]|nr:YncE family protein [Acidobacteriaceae bacterium]
MPVKQATRLAVAAVAAALFVTIGNAQSVKGSVALSGVPEGLAANFFTNKIYVAISSFGGPNDTLAVIDGKTDTVATTISIPPVGYQVAVNMLTDRIYVGGCFTDAGGNNNCEVAVVDGRHNKVLGVIPVTTTAGNGIQGLAVNPITDKLYVSNASDNVIDVINRHGKITATISLADQTPIGIAVNPFACRGGKIYVALASGEVDLIDGKTNSITTTATVGTSNANVAVNWATGNAFVTNDVPGPSTVGVLDGDGNVLANVNVGNTPFGVDVDLGTNLAFVTNLGDGTLSVIDGKTNTVSATLPVTGNFVALNPLTEKVYVGGQDNEVIVISEK